MGNKNIYAEDISGLLSAGRFEETKNYIAENSNLPGPRGNLELAEVFYEYFTEQTLTEELWAFLLELCETSAETNDPRELLPFCGAEALANIFFCVNDERKLLILEKIRAAMNDGRWRMREAAANCCQIIGEKDVSVLKEWILSVYPESNLLEKRGIAAALAHPPLLKNQEAARFSLKVCADIFEDVLKLDERSLKSEDFKVLKKGLDYAPSVFVAALPEEGFLLLEKYAKTGNAKMNSIIKSNLSKNRLLKKYGDRIEKIILT